MILSDAQIDSGALARRLLTPANNLVPVNVVPLRRSLSQESTSGQNGWSTMSTSGGGNTTFTMAISTAYALSPSTQSIEITPVTDAFVSGPSTMSVQFSYAAVAGRIYTNIVKVRSLNAGQTGQAQLAFWDAAGTRLGTASGGYFPLSTTGFSDLRVSGVAPASTAYVGTSIQFTDTGTMTGERFYIGGYGFWEGAGGSWVNGGERLDFSTLGGYWNAAGTGYYRWNNVTNAYVLIYGS